MNQWIFLNDVFVPSNEAKLFFRDLSIQRGYGIFDFFRIHNGRAVFLEDHLDRFYRSAQEMHLPVNQSRQELASIIARLIVKNEMTNSGIRITLTGGYSNDGYTLSQPNLVVAQQHFQLCTQEQFDNGIRLMTYNHQRQLPHVKTIDYLMAIHLQPQLKKIGADDILYHNNGLVRECPRANFFIVTRDNVLVTPEAGILKGITRKKVLQLAKAVCEVEEREFSLDEVFQAKEAFITSSTKQVLPVRQIDEHIFINQPPITTALNNKLLRFITENNLVSAE